MTEISFSEAFHEIFPAIPEILISSEARETIAAIAFLLPGRMAGRTFGFECPLENPGKADFLVSTSLAQQGPEMLADFGGKGTDSMEARQGIRMVSEFGKLWAGHESGMSLPVDDVWLEFDIKDSNNEFPLPGIFYSPYHLNGHAPPFLMHSIVRNMQHIHERMTGRQWRANLKELAEFTITHFELCSSPEKRFIVGMMLGRDANWLRLVFSTTGRRSIIIFLQHVGWKGDLDVLAASLDKWFSMVDHVWMNIDISDRFGPKIGFELSFNHRRSPGREARWLDVLNYLVATQMCSESQKKAILDYSGYSISSTRPIMTDEVGAEWKVYWIRNLYYIKIVVHENLAMTAKAYLSCSYLKKELTHVY